MGVTGTATPTSVLIGRGPREQGSGRRTLRLLCTSGNGHVRSGVVERVERLGATVHEAKTLAGALEYLEGQRVDACIVDLTTERAAAATLRVLRARHPSLPLVGVVDPEQAVTAGDAVQSGLCDVLPWPFDERDLAVVLANISDRARSKGDRPSAEANGDDPLFTQSAVMQDVLSQAAALADARTGVILCGEPSTGRTLVARRIHRLGDGGNTRPFVDVDCGGANPQEVEQRLFGVASDRRASAADTALAPRVEAGGACVDARGGTLYLRNLTELPARVQSALGRVLRDREALFDDGREIIDLDVRAIAALEPDVDEATSDGRLQSDLIERLAQSRIDLPALRHRREDVPALSAWLLDRSCRVAGVSPKAFSRSALALLSALPWHGNVRELEALIASVVASVPRSVLQIDDLLEHASLDGMSPRLEAGVSLREARARFERECISAVLRRHHGRVGEAAKALGIQRTNLYRKVRQLNVSRSLLSARK